MEYAIRPYHPSDLCALFRVCLLTGDSGSDASALYHDPDLLGQIYVAPYAVFEPDLCFVLTQNGVPCAYVLGTHDTAAFNQRCAQDWYPVLQTRYATRPPEDTTPDADLIRHIHRTAEPANPALAAYPAHLHIDLLPEAQGQGWGRRLIAAFTARLRALGVAAVYLGVGASNLRAIGFYAHVGFHVIQAYPGWVAYGMRLD